MRPAAEVRRAWRRAVGAVQTMPPAQRVLRGVIGGTGGAALLVAPGGRLVISGLLALLAVPAVIAAVLRPDAGGPAVVLAAAVAAWMFRYGVTAAPLDTAFVLAALLYLHHLTAALCAALPPTAVVDREVWLRWAAHALLVLGLAAVLAGGVRLLGRPAASGPLELLGIAVAVALVGIPVLLARRR
jgi:hypothetical protein